MRKRANLHLKTLNNQKRTLSWSGGVSSVTRHSIRGGGGVSLFREGVQI